MERNTMRVLVNNSDADIDAAESLCNDLAGLYVDAHHTVDNDWPDARLDWDIPPDCRVGVTTNTIRSADALVSLETNPDIGVAQRTAIALSHHRPVFHVGPGKPAGLQGDILEGDGIPLRIILGAHAPDYDGRIMHTLAHLMNGAASRRDLEAYGELLWCNGRAPDSSCIRLLARAWLDLPHFRGSRCGDKILCFLRGRPAHLGRFADRLASEDPGIREALVDMWKSVMGNHMAMADIGRDPHSIDSIGKEVLAKAGVLSESV